MAEFDLEVCYKPGRTNTNADALSRAPLCSVGAVNAMDIPKNDTFINHEATPMAESQRDDTDLAARILFMETGTVPDNPEHADSLP